MRPVFRDLANPELLKKCLHGGTQNPNESVNNVIWSRVPKKTFVQLEVLSLGTYDAVSSFNMGNVSKLEILRKVCIEPGDYTVQAMECLDKQRLLRAKYYCLQKTKERFPTALKNIILDNAKLYIPRGNVKGYIPLFTHNASSLKPLLDRRKQLLESFNENNSLNDSQGGLRTEINQINAKIRKSYAQLKRSRWRELCINLDSRTTNSKLWRIVKKINKEQEQCEESNTVIDTNGQVFPDDKAAANGLAVYYQETSKLVFTSEDKSVMKRAKNIIHGCRTSDVGD
ncbi:uncharacterized protein TNCV_2681761 [Trichonephila clavipes]|nr:uncharacterized protein TNCV_2681761 [Trichonephila clavipes]